MMRPMKLAGSQLMFGKGSIEFVETIAESSKKVVIVIGGSSMKKSGILDEINNYFIRNDVETHIINGIESDPSIKTVLRGANEMIEFKPDLIVALGGGSVMDAAKAMWVYYEHPELKTLEDILPPIKIPKLRGKAKLCCIPSTSGTASEVSRSVVLTDNETGMKYGIGDMEMMPDIAICDPNVTKSMPKHITAETGMDALTHSLEALVSNRANYLSNVLAKQSAIDIIKTLPKAYYNGEDLDARESMLNASMVAGMAFTNVSLGIAHSMAHTIGSYFHISHGLADAILLPYIINFNSKNELAKLQYDDLAAEFGEDDLVALLFKLNRDLNIPTSFNEIIENKVVYMDMLDTMAENALNDGCTKTNPIIPTIDQLKGLFIIVFQGE